MTGRTFLYLRKKKFRIITDSSHVFRFKKPVCPICGACITATCTGWILDKKWGCWIVDMLDIECTSMPDIDDVDTEEFDDWVDGHYRDPYSDWLPLELKFIRALSKKIRYIFSPNHNNK